MDDGDAELNLSELTVNELYNIATEAANAPVVTGAFALSISPRMSVEQVGRQIDRGEYGVVYASTPRFWEFFRKEFHTLVCTRDKKYQEVRRDISRSGGKTQLAIVSTISAAVGGSLGVAAGSLVPVCAICLIAIMKMGREAFCRAEKLGIKVGPEYLK